MGLVLLGFVYAFGAACIMNYFIMFVRIRISEKYIQRRETLVESYHKKHPREAEAAAATAAEAADASKKEAAVQDWQDLLPEEPLHVVFLHPDLGIGGAERLIVDAAVGLMKNQSVHPVVVTIVTNHHDKARAFPETVDGTIRVVVRGGGLPMSIFGRGKILCASIRMAFAAFATCWAFPETNCFVVDQVAAAMPMLRFCAGKTPVLFYSHFPDQLCDPNRADDGELVAAAPGHRAYRSLFNTIEEKSMNSATSIVCNSRFSREVTVATFPQLAEKIREDADVFYPPVNMEVHEVATETLAQSPALKELHDTVKSSITFVSINRYERRKNIMLVVEAFAKLLAMDEFKAAPAEAADGSSAATSTPARQRLLLVIAGGYDPRLEGNVSYAKELEARATELHIPSNQIRFMKNISEDEKAILLSSMLALVYTPSGEHFGIVPVEAMAYDKPVVAVSNGGPCETIGDAEKEDPSTCGGLLCAADADAFADKMARFARVASFAKKMGAQGRARILQAFSMETFSQKLIKRIVDLTNDFDKLLLEEGLEIEKEVAKKAARGASGAATAPQKEKTE